VTLRSLGRMNGRSAALKSRQAPSNLSCKSCGHVFVGFLQQMAENNAKQMAQYDPKKSKHLGTVGCPHCGKTQISLPTPA